jgi:hypothetical protein
MFLQDDGTHLPSYMVPRKSQYESSSCENDKFYMVTKQGLSFSSHKYLLYCHTVDNYITRETA